MTAYRPLTQRSETEVKMYGTDSEKDNGKVMDGSEDIMSEENMTKFSTTQAMSLRMNTRNMKKTVRI